MLAQLGWPSPPVVDTIFPSAFTATESSTDTVMGAPEGSYILTL